MSLELRAPSSSLSISHPPPLSLILPATPFLPLFLLCFILTILSLSIYIYIFFFVCSVLEHYMAKSRWTQKSLDHLAPLTLQILQTLWHRFGVFNPFPLFQHHKAPVHRTSSVKKWLSQFGVCGDLTSDCELDPGPWTSLMLLCLNV